MQQKWKLRRVAASGALALGLVLSFAATGSAATSPHGKIQNKTISFAEGPSANPNYIFPFVNCNYFSVDNLNQFQELMYRPAYWFGLGSSPAEVPTLSLYKAPAWNTASTSVTLTAQTWAKWSDGQAMDNQSFMFFLNMYEGAVQNGNIGGEYCGYNPGFGVPDQIASVVETGGATGTSLTINWTKAVNQNWMLYNYLSEITPMPAVWDTTNGTNAAGCSTDTYGSNAAETDCQAVYNYLNNDATNTGDWANGSQASGKVDWGVSDGPWKITKADSLGNITFNPNSTYAGPQKAQVQTVKELSETSTTAEEASLATSSGPTLGFVDPTDLPKGAPKPGGLGPNLPGAVSKHYTLTTGKTWSFNYILLMFPNSGTSAGNSDSPKAQRDAELNQLYVRQALEEGIDQAGIIKNYFENYGEDTCGPVPAIAPTSMAAKQSCEYAFGIHTAQLLLEAHGWSYSGGNMTCTKPGTAAGDCGAGISNNAPLLFDYSYLSASASPAAADAAQLEIADWEAIGFQINGEPQGFNTAISNCFSTNMCSWGGGWIYAPDYYPSGESLFATNGSFNLGNYTDSTMDSDIQATTNGSANLTAYNKYAAQQLPVLYVPNGTGTGEILKTLKTNLKTKFAANPLGNFMPEYFHF